MKFTKKPVTIEATQWFEDGDHPAVVMKTGPGRYADDGVPWIETLEGGHIVTPGDWIITGVKGEHYPCKQDIFELTYDKAAPQPAAPVQPPKFPTMLRKMWSGSEVQQWINDNWEPKC